MKSCITLPSALSSLYAEVSYSAFYRDIFPAGSFQQAGVFTPGVYNGIAVSVGSGERRTKRYTVTDDLDVLDILAESSDFCIMSPIGYVGKSRTSSNARLLYALAIDLDGVHTLQQWEFFLHQIEDGESMVNVVWGLPRPTYIVASGTGMHLYYVFDTPVQLFPNIVKELEKLKKRLTWQAWTQGASSLSENVQYESLFQGFRVVGTITKVGTRARAFKVGDKVSVEYLNQFVPAADRAVNIKKYKSKLRLEDAKKKYPEWYQERIIEKRPKGTWTCKKDLYNWWIRTLSSGATQGHRYWCIMALATYAKKCGVDKNTLEEDAYGLIPLMNQKGDSFTEEDVMSALEAFQDGYINYPIDAISSRTGIHIEKNKRNGRKQEIHLRGARAIQAINDEANGTNWRNTDGRPSARPIVMNWRKEHPDGNKTECQQDTGLSQPTIRKWWNQTSGSR